MPASHTAFLQREEYTTATEEENSGKHDGVSCISCRLKKNIVPLNLHAHSAFIPFNHFFLNMLYAKISKFSYFSKLVLPIDYCFVSSLGLSTSPCLACRLFATRDVCVNHYHDACVFSQGSIPKTHSQRAMAQIFLHRIKVSHHLDFPSIWCLTICLFGKNRVFQLQNYQQKDRWEIFYHTIFPQNFGKIPMGFLFSRKHPLAPVHCQLAVHCPLDSCEGRSLNRNSNDLALEMSWLFSEMGTENTGILSKDISNTGFGGDTITTSPEGGVAGVVGLSPSTCGLFRSPGPPDRRLSTERLRG